MNANHFQTFFDVVVLNSRPILEKVFHLRHQVYCEELGFEPRRASRLEHDKYDIRSIDCLLRHKASNTCIGFHQGLEGVFAMMEPSLARRLHPLNILFDQVGAAVEHHGFRAPFLARCERNLNTARPASWTLMSKIQNSIEIPCIKAASWLKELGRSSERADDPQ